MTKRLEFVSDWLPDPLPALIRARNAVEAEARRRRRSVADWRDGHVVFTCPECPADDYAGALCSVCGGERPPT